MPALQAVFEVLDEIFEKLHPRYSVTVASTIADLLMLVENNISNFLKFGPSLMADKVA